MACKACGFYKGKQVLNVSRAKERAAERLKKKAFEKAHATEAPEEKSSEETAVPKTTLSPKSEAVSQDKAKPKTMRSFAKRLIQRKKPE